MQFKPGSDSQSDKKGKLHSCYEDIIKERSQLVVPKSKSFIKPKDATKPPWVPKERADEASWSPRNVEKSAVDNQAIQRAKHDLQFVNQIIKKKQDQDKEAERKRLYALSDPETEPAADSSANFQAIKKPKIFADEQFRKNISQMMRQAKEIQEEVEKEQQKKQEMEEYIKTQVGQKGEVDLGGADSRRHGSKPPVERDEDDEDNQLGSEGLHLEDVTITNAEANKRNQKKELLPAVIKRTHEINDIVSKEELALILSNDFLFGEKIEIDAEKLKQMQNSMKIDGKKNVDGRLKFLDKIIKDLD